MNQLEKDRRIYSAAKDILKQIRDHRDELTPQQMRTLKGQALAGDIDGAAKGLAAILREKWT